MKRKKEKAIINYLSYAMVQMDLRDWELKVNFKLDTESDIGGTCEPLFGRKLAYISLPSDMDNQKESDVRQTLIHELLHLHFAPLTIQSRELDKILGVEAYEMFDIMFTQTMEYCVDGIATAWAESLEEFTWKFAEK